MTIIKRIFLFFLINAVIILSISFLLQIFHVQPYLTPYGLDIRHLALFCLIWGMGGAFISLFFSRALAKWLMKIKIISQNDCNEKEYLLLRIVQELSQKAALERSPQIGIYSSGEINAFATGPTKNRSLIAVSSALLERMNAEELRGVIAHELSHIINGDMVTMTLLQGVVNAFVMFLARLLAFVLSSASKRGRRSSYSSYYLIMRLFEIVFMLLGSIVIAGYSRFREYRADNKGARLVGKYDMISALKSLQMVVQEPQKTRCAFQALKISYAQKKSPLSIFATHPPLEKRIEKLQNLFI